MTAFTHLKDKPGLFRTNLVYYVIAVVSVVAAAVIVAERWQ